MAKLNNPEEMDLIYQTSKQVFAGKISSSNACKKIQNQTIASEASIKMYFSIYAAMKKGTCYKMGTGETFTRFLIESIYKDDGEDAMLIALSAAKKNAEYRISCDNEQPGIERTCRELIKEYNLQIKYEDLPGYLQTKPSDEEPDAISQKLKTKKIKHTKTSDNKLRIKITMGDIVFEAEGDPDTVISQEARFMSDTLPIALSMLDGVYKKNMTNTGSEQPIELYESIPPQKNKESEKTYGDLLAERHPNLLRLKDRMDFKARMIPLMYCLQEDKVQEDFSIKEIKDIMLKVLGEQVNSKQIEDVIARRSDWFEKTSQNPRRYKIVDVGCDYARNILN